jgi:hypothetical protein
MIILLSFDSEEDYLIAIRWLEGGVGLTLTFETSSAEGAPKNSLKKMNKDFSAFK